MKDFDELKRLPRAIWILCIANVINRMGTMAFLFLGIYLVKTMGYSTKVAGVFLGSLGLVSLIVSPYGGWLCDRFGAKNIMVFSLLVTGVLLLIFPFLSGLPILLAATVLTAATGEIFGPASATFSSATIPSDLKKTSLALNRLSHNLGLSIGPAAGGLLATYSFHWVFWIDAFTSIVAGFVLLFFLQNLRSTEVDKTSYLSNLRFLTKDQGLMYFLLSGIPLNLAWFQFSTTLPLFMVKTLGLKEYQFGLLFTLNTILIVLLEIPITIRTSTWKPRVILSIASILFAVGFGFLISKPELLHLVLMVGFITAGEMLLMPAGAAFISNISPGGREGSYMGIFAASYSFSALSASVGGTWMLDSLGGQALWIFCLTFCLISCGLFLRIPDRS